MSAPVRPDLEAIERAAEFVHEHERWGDSWAVSDIVDAVNRDADDPTARAVRVVAAYITATETRERDEVHARWGLRIEQLARQQERERCAAELDTIAADYDKAANKGVIGHRLELRATAGRYRVAAAIIRALPDREEP